MSDRKRRLKVQSSSGTVWWVESSLTFLGFDPSLNGLRFLVLWLREPGDGGELAAFRVINLPVVKSKIVWGGFRAGVIEDSAESFLSKTTFDAGLLFQGSYGNRSPVAGTNLRRSWIVF